jgi:Interferon-induced transmembrane protein
MKCQYCRGDNSKGRTICISCGGPLDPDIEASEYTDEVIDTDDISAKASYDVPDHVPDNVPKYVPSYLVPAFLLAICYIILCGLYALPFLIVAIVYSFKVRFHLQNEQYEDAKRASKLAMIWCWVSFGVWIIIGGIFLIAAAIQAYNDGL